MCKVITCKSYKGGIGATSVITDIATELKIRGNKVLVIDLDENTTMTTNIGASFNNGNIYDILKSNINAKDAIQKTEMFDFIAGSSQMSLFTEEFPNPDDAFILKDLCEVLREDYDYIFFDNCAGRNKLFTATILACDWSILPTLNDEGSLNQVKDTQKEIEEIKKTRTYGPYCNIKVIGYILNRYKKNGISDNTISILDNFAAEDAFIYTVADAVIISENKTFHTSTMLLPQNSKTKRIQEDINAIVDEIERLKEAE